MHGSECTESFTSGRPSHWGFEWDPLPRPWQPPWTLPWERTESWANRATLRALRMASCALRMSFSSSRTLHVGHESGEAKLEAKLK